MLLCNSPCFTQRARTDEDRKGIELEFQEHYLLISLLLRVLCEKYFEQSALMNQASILRFLNSTLKNDLQK
jgi:hypothetical protein